MKSILFLGALLTAACAAAGRAAAPPRSPRSCHLPGVEEALRCLTLPVPLEPAQAGHPEPARDGRPRAAPGARPDPLFVLAGGPGEAGSDVLPLLSTAFRRVRATRDIVFIDQRGTGLSGKLECPSDADEDAQLERRRRRRRPARAASRASQRAASPPTRRPPPRATSRPCAARSATARSTCGAARTAPASAQAYARAYPAGVRALVLDARGRARPGDPGRRPRRPGRARPAVRPVRAGRRLRRAPTRTCAANSTALVGRLDAGPAEAEPARPAHRAPVDVTMTSARLLDTVHSILYSPADARRLPFLVHSASAGPLAAVRRAPQPGRRLFRRRLAAPPCCTWPSSAPRTCRASRPRWRASDASPLTRTAGRPHARPVPRDERAARALRAARAHRRAGAAAVRRAGPGHAAAPRPGQPPRYMAHAQLLTAPNAGHGVSQLGCAPRLLRDFLDQPAANSRRRLPERDPGPDLPARQRRAATLNEPATP